MGAKLLDSLFSNGSGLTGALAVLAVTIAAVEILRFAAAKAQAGITRTSAGGRGEHVAAGWTLLLEQATPPLILFVWIWGASAIAGILQRAYGQQPRLVFIFTIVDWLEHLANIAALLWLVFRLINVAEAIMLKWARRTEGKWDDVIAAITARALRLLIPLVAVIIVVPTLNVPPKYHDLLKQGAGVLLAGAVGFILFELVSTGEAAVVEQFRLESGNNLAQRKIQTQVKVLKRIVVALIVLFTAASMLMVFESVRRLAQSLLASAGLAGVVLGFAAQKSLATLVAGIQIAFTQPIRIDDVVIVEGEWGRIEEITMTYVVVAIWDLRRMVLPITYFIEKPFQNWTRVSADLLGTVFLYVDYSVPVEAVRQELTRILAATNLWDKKVNGVQMTDAKEKTIELRILVSAADSSRQWDLRCLVREKLIAFLQREYPRCLPRLRWENPEDGRRSAPPPPPPVVPSLP